MCGGIRYCFALSDDYENKNLGGSHADLCCVAIFDFVFEPFDASDIFWAGRRNSREATAGGRVDPWGPPKKKC